jgi:HEAT repeat protein
MKRTIAFVFAGSLVVTAQSVAAQSVALPPIPPVPPVPAVPALPPLPPEPPLPPDFVFDVSRFQYSDFDFDFDFDFPPFAFQGVPQPSPKPAPVAPPRPPRPARADSPRDAERMYEEARKMIDSGRYERALDALDRVATATASSRADAALYWKSYAQWKLDQRADALATLADMRKRFPQSRWAKDAQALDVEIRQASGQSVSPDQANEELKLLALRGLMTSDPDRAIPMIEQLLGGSNTVRVKENALFVLSQSRSARAREIIAAAAKGSVNPDLQLRAIRYIGVMGSPDSRQVLDDAYRSTTDLAVRRAIIRSLLSAGDRQRLLGLAKSEGSPELRAEAVRSLAAMSAATELDELYRSEASAEVKSQIIRGMMSSGNLGALTRLASSEKDPELRRAAIRNLGAMGPAKTADTLRSIYASDGSADVRAEVIDALTMQQNASVLVALARAEKDAALKRRIVERLSSMKSKEATDYMLELLK